MENIDFVATCLFGLEKFVRDEIIVLGYTVTAEMDGRVTFTGPIDAIARANIWLRTAERVYIKLGDFPADSFDALFEGTAALPWERWIGQDDAFPVKGHSIKSKLTSIPDCQKIIKKAVVKRLGGEYGIEWFKEDGVKYQIDFFIFKDKATLMIDTSGAPLFKRGYRTEAGEAPLRETLAAAMVKLTHPMESVLLWDPMAGSGTIPIEAALLMTNTAPGMNRAFAAEEFYDVPPELFKRCREEARELRKFDTAFQAYASDRDPSMIAVAQANIKRAGMDCVVKAFVRDALTVENDGRRATLILNPPYGERMLDAQTAHKLYGDMGKAFARLGSWQIFVITSDESFEQHYGRKADKVKTLYNGMIKCGFYQYTKH